MPARRFQRAIAVAEATLDAERFRVEPLDAQIDAALREAFSDLVDAGVGWMEACLLHDDRRRGSNFDLFAKLGWGYTDVEASGFGVSATDSDDSFFGGIGAEWHGERLSVRGELQFDDDVPDTLVYTIGLGYAF